MVMEEVGLAADADSFVMLTDNSISLYVKSQLEVHVLSSIILLDSTKA